MNLSDLVGEALEIAKRAESAEARGETDIAALLYLDVSYIEEDVAMRLPKDTAEWRFAKVIAARAREEHDRLLGLNDREATS